MRYLSAENTYYRALTALARNEGAAAYDLLRSAIQTNPMIDRYHGTYTQVNLALANAIAGKEDINDEDRQTIAQLIQQAIREGKATVSLNPTRAGNWELLASTYRAVIPLAQGADQFAVQTYNQAIALDPLNTNYRIALGGILYAAQQFDAAIDVFKLAVLTKPDHANAHYNLAMAYKEAGDTELAIQQLTTVLSLVPRDSEDYEVARQQLEELQQGLQAETQEGGDLTAPGSDIDQPALDPQLELPDDAQPPAGPEAEVGNEEEVGEDQQPQESASPSPSASASPTATPLP
jgi:tetratricopeptide (TPR) repeat protein